MQNREQLLVQLGQIIELWELASQAFEELVPQAGEGDGMAASVCAELTAITESLQQQVEGVIKNLTDYHWRVDETVIAARLSNAGISFSKEAAEDVKQAVVIMLVKAVKQVYDKSLDYEVKREEV